ncbi:MAG: zinc ribbon domain-containing protein [candidate division FCPU426 bacterium]
MPRYVYHCPQCSQSFEVEKSMSRVLEPEACPACGQSGTRVFTPPAVSATKFGAPAAAGQADSGCTSCCANGACGL